MLDQSSVNSWLAEFVGRLQKAFGNRLVFVGHHGSWARGEAGSQSDIDTIVILDRIDSEDLLAYRSAVESMPGGGRGASGLLSSVPEMRARSRSELLQYFYGCEVLHGSLDGMVEPPTTADLVEDARLKASNNLLVARHYLLYPHDLTQKVHALRYPLKECVYALQAWMLARRGRFFGCKEDLLRALTEADDKLVVTVVRDWGETQEDREARPRHYVELLERWSRQMLLRLGSVPAQDPGAGHLRTIGREKTAGRQDIIFVTGPYSAPTDEGVERNIQRAIEMGRRVFRKGYFALVPHLLVRDFYVPKDTSGPFSYEALMQFTLAMVPKCDALLLYDHSPGAAREWRLAESLGKPIYFDISELPDCSSQ